MIPRYKSNKKWTEFPTELKQQISDIFSKTFQKQAGETATFHVAGRIYSQEILLRVGINRAGSLRFLNFEVSVDHNNEQEKVVELIYVAVDAIATVMADFFEKDEELELPYVWVAYPFKDYKVWIQFTTENPHLEAEANKLLGITEDGLLKNSDDEKSDDILDATEEEFDEFAEKLNQDPTMFGGNATKIKKKKDDLH